MFDPDNFVCDKSVLRNNNATRCYTDGARISNYALLICWYEWVKTNRMVYY